MAVTLQQIAEAAGVSRGTVDRALNDRGRINPEVAERIREIAHKAGYQPNRAGRALAMTRRSVMIGVIIQAAGTPFMEDVLQGVMEAKAEVERLGAEVLIRTIHGLNAVKADEFMHELKDAGCGGIAVVAVEDERMKQTINAFADDNISVITFNSDIERSKRICFVGQNAYQSGRTAAGLMAEILPESARALVISGYPTSFAHKRRTKGFVDELKLFQIFYSSWAAMPVWVLGSPLVRTKTRLHSISGIVLPTFLLYRYQGTAPYFKPFP